MRLLAWNCCSGPLERKRLAIEGLAADVAVVPEFPRIAEPSDRAQWIGSNPRKGMAVFCRPPWSLTPLKTRRRLPRFISLFQVSGPEPFVLWAIWTQNDGAERYVRGLHRAVDACAALLKAHPTVMLGDFNSHSLWNHEHPAELNHSALVGKLGRFGLISAYHAHHGEEHGAESRPTFFEYRHAHRPYHIDYCFLPRSWAGRIGAVTLGAHAEWAQYSDHMPLIMDLDHSRR